MEPPTKRGRVAEAPPARIAVIGAAWWSQGWHLPQLARNPDAEIAAIVQRSEQPTAAPFLNTTLESKTQLAQRYPGVPIFSSCEELIADAEVLAKVDGVSESTPTSSHSVILILWLPLASAYGTCTEPIR